MLRSLAYPQSSQSEPALTEPSDGRHPASRRRRERGKGGGEGGGGGGGREGGGGGGRVGVGVCGRVDVTVEEEVEEEEKEEEEKEVGGLKYLFAPGGEVTAVGGGGVGVKLQEHIREQTNNNTTMSHK